MDAAQQWGRKFENKKWKSRGATAKTWMWLIILAVSDKINEQKDLLTESEGSGFLEAPLVLPLDSTERQWHNHVITKVRDNSNNLSCRWKYPQTTQIFILMPCYEPFSVSDCCCFSSTNGRPLKLGQNPSFLSIREIYSLIWGFLVQHRRYNEHREIPNGESKKLMSLFRTDFQGISGAWRVRVRSPVFAAVPSGRPHQTAAMTLVRRHSPLEIWVTANSLIHM